MFWACAYSSYAKLFLIDIGIQWAGATAAIIFKTEKFYDLLGAVTNILLAQLSYEFSRKQTARQLVQSNLVTLWAARLGLYLFIRILKDGRDKRFADAKKKPIIMYVFWTVQAAWCYVTLLPTLMLNEQARDPPLGPQDYIGWSLFGVGFLFETVADLQKTMFRGNKDNAGKFITSGLWGISRHPNYFGEILLRFGLYISASSTFRGWQFLSVLSPVFVHVLITKLSGIPMLEKGADKKWGGQEDYENYKKNTPILVPFLNFIGIG